MTTLASSFCFDAAAALAFAAAAGHGVVPAVHHHHHLWEAGQFVSDAA